MDDQDPIQLKHLFKRPVVRQWLYNGNYYREKDERQSSRFELFSDLLFVGVVHQLADGLAEEGAATALNVAKFVLVFYPAFSIWSDMRRQLNMSGTDDCFQRLYVLVIMLILVGYTSNAAGILIFPAHAGTILMSHNQELGADGTVALAAEYGLRSLSRRAEEGGHSERPVLVEAIGNTGYWFAEGYHRAVYSSIAFYLSAKVLKLMVHFVYGLMLPKFRTALWVEMVPIFLLACTYLPLAFIYNPGWICAIIVAGIIIDLFSKYLINGLLQRVHRYYKRKGKPIFIPAQSVEHIAERTVLFVVLVTGECILNSTFVATHEHYGLSTQLLRASLSVINSFYLVWIYFDCDASRTFLHALRVNPWSAITFSLLHYPLCAALILLSSSIPRLVKNSSSEMGYRWFYAASMSVAMLCMAIIGLLHRNLDIAGSAYWSQRARIAFRLVCSAGFALLPLGGEDWNNLEFLLAYNIILGLLVFSETAGKLGVVGRKFDQAKADAYYAALKSDSADPEEKRSAEEVFKALQEGLEANEAINPHTSRVKLSKKDVWHPYEDLMGDERGDEDVGVEGELGQMEVKERMDAGQRWALVAN
ncbi:hypothetical protein BCV69DRAFT_267382 [Microstroma glucosiphilum]|uniref:Uncharacterized protein n=1 Tax=Pseudomicrostroma glucosiphilum TaxID=1684307 RepID=A0A316UBE2_9BASI|nr:hypothetical protein BCV69DRAFT_267382 [Pseudomicrostroma glucosiphilum]PWN22174.1 hypothetical protein BCV69DRAFT_267382 [Pseudomicrostroma glucosiphilum]